MRRRRQAGLLIALLLLAAAAAATVAHLHARSQQALSCGNVVDPAYNRPDIGFPHRGETCAGALHRQRIVVGVLTAAGVLLVAAAVPLPGSERRRPAAA